MGDVFLAREVAADRLVALKYLRATGSLTAVERFLTEVRSLARLDHPRIVKVFATDFYTLTPYFSMEYAAGGTLADRVAKSGPLPAEEAARIMAEVARAIESAHAAGVLHRDLKPSNILLAVDGTPKVGDFGLAKSTDREEGLTLSGSPVGTPSFMPPEQVSRRHGEIGPASDVYGLGATLYFLVSGRAPFEGESSVEVASKVVGENAPRLRSIKSDLPEGLEAIVMKCLEKRPADRYASAAALADDLQRFLHGKAQQAPRLTRWRRLRRWAGRRGVRIAVALLVVAVIAVLLGSKVTPSKEEPRDVIRKEIAMGKSVRLLKSDGSPRWSEWPMSTGDLAFSDDDGGTCSFTARGCNVLLLLDDPGVDHYRIAVELCERRKSAMVDPDTGKPKNPYSDTVGLVLGFGSQLNADNSRKYSLEEIGFSEYDREGKAPQSRQLHLRELLIVERNPLQRSISTSRGPGTPIAPEVPGPPWRRLVLDVSSEAITAIVPTFSRALPVPEIMSNRRQLVANLHNTNLGASPDWSPRMPIGIWCYDAEVAFRNLIIEAVH
jgi:serine/threonine protein kinase